MLICRLLYTDAGCLGDDAMYQDRHNVKRSVVRKWDNGQV